jgi:hypothetical protein
MLASLGSSLQYIANALSLLYTFNHDKCDAVLAARQVIIPGVFSPDNQPPFRNTLYLFPGLMVLLTFASIVSMWVWLKWRHLGAFSKSVIVIAHMLPFGFFAYLLIFYVIGIARYSNLCRHLSGAT